MVDELFEAIPPPMRFWRLGYQRITYHPRPAKPKKRPRLKYRDPPQLGMVRSQYRRQLRNLHSPYLAAEARKKDVEKMWAGFTGHDPDRYFDEPNYRVYLHRPPDVRKKGPRKLKRYKPWYREAVD